MKELLYGIPPRIAVPSKGPLYEGSVDALRRAGVTWDEEDRKLCFRSANFLDKQFVLGFLRPKDIVRLISSERLDMGIAGQDSIAELGLPVKDLGPLGFGRGEVVLAGKVYSGDRFFLPSLRDKKVATCYPKLAFDFFARRGIAAQIEEYGGALEGTIDMGLASAIVDVKETGRSLVVNGLSELAKLMDTQAALIQNCSYRGDTTLQNRLADRLINQARKAT